MDPLLDILRGLQLTGGVFLDAEFTAPWCVTARVGPEDCAGLLRSPSHVIAYHYVLEGRCVLSVDGWPTVDVQAGEVVLLPRNDPHRLGSAANVRAVSAEHLIEPAAGGGLARIVYGGGGESARILCGFLGTDTPDPPIAAILPAVLTLPVRDGMAGAWIETSFRFAAQELMDGRPGSPAILARLAELLFMEAVRQHVASTPAEQSGWIAGLRDPVVGRALALLHSENDHRWTSEALARATGASRSAFAERFTRLIGEPPMRYLARQRLRSAAQRLRVTAESIATVALGAGYESESAFSRAFKREYGTSPAAWRKARASES
jgi:AraC-like DNA-binding protein